MIVLCVLLLVFWTKKGGSCLVQILVTDRQSLPGDDVVYPSYQLLQTQQLLIMAFLSLLGICAVVGEAQTWPGLSHGHIIQHTE